MSEKYERAWKKLQLAQEQINREIESGAFKVHRSASPRPVSNRVMCVRSFNRVRREMKH